MERPLFLIPSIPASTELQGAATIDLVRARVCSVTAKVTHAALADADVTVNIYYSPDGNNWDTIPYTAFEVTHTAGATVQRTCRIAPPEHGYLKIKLSNADATRAVTNCEVWYSIQSWLPAMPSHGDISTKEMTD